MKAKVIALAAAFVIAGAAAGRSALGDEARGDAAAVEAAQGSPGVSGKALAQKYPFLDPEWTSRSFFPPEYCRFLIRIDRGDATYWQIKRWCEKQRRRR